MTSIDPQLAEKILHEVKSQGLFDEFRKDSISDVDTKPAYQNLRQRVENTAQKFLAEQRWTPDTNKYQLRERLRRHIVESGFLDVGVERIVDQVVNPKIGSVFQPRIEEIAYKFVGITPPLPTKREPPPPPPPTPMPPLPPFPPMDDSPLQIETDASNNLLPTDLEQVSPDSDKVKEEDINDTGMLEEKADDDDESPPFEPLTECKSPKSEDNFKNEEAIDKKFGDSKESKKETFVKIENIKVEPLRNDESCVPKEKISCNDALASQESQLSQVSSDSRISSASNQLLQNGNDVTSAMDNTDVNISEEAQMPKFNENSTGTEGSANITSELHFDIKKDEIKFEGTERKANILGPDRTEFCKDAPVIKDAYISDSLEMKGSFSFTKLNVEVEPCNTTPGPAISVSSQDDTSSAQLCIVENSIQKCQQEDSSTNTTTNNSQVKQNDSKSERNGKLCSSSSSSSSRPKKSSSKDKKRHSSDKNQQHDSKDREKNKYRERDIDRDRERYRDRDRYSDAKNNSKASSSSSRRHESSEKHKSSSSKRSEKGRHISSSSRSESHSHHKSSKRDRRDKDDKSKSQKYSSSSRKEHRSGDRKSRTDDHNESREKIRWRKSTDSNDEDKNPSNPQQNKTTNDTESAVNESSKNNGNGSNKYSKETKKNDTHENKTSENVKSHGSRVVLLNDVLEHPSTNFVEFETKSSVQVHTVRQRSPRLSKERLNVELLYFEQANSELQKRLDLISDAIDRCAHINSSMNTQERIQNDDINENSNDEHSTSKDSACYQNYTLIEDMVRHTETKATLLVDCFHYSDYSDKNSLENVDTTSPKRLKLSTECNITKLQAVSSMVNTNTKENQMKENNSIMTDEDNKKTTLSKRIDTMAKLSQQQRYSSEDLYKPRPVLGQRSKRRGLDTVI